MFNAAGCSSFSSSPMFSGILSTVGRERSNCSTNYRNDCYSSYQPVCSTPLFPSYTSSYYCAHECNDYDMQRYYTNNVRADIENNWTFAPSFDLSRHTNVNSQVNNFSLSNGFGGLDSSIFMNNDGLRFGGGFTGFGNFS